MIVPKNSDTKASTTDDLTIINVDSDFKGDLEKAIAAAKSGDVVKLGRRIYDTDQIVIDKDITIDGQQGSIINGGGTSESIFYLTADASGTTIQDVEITNGNNGIIGENASNLTLKNLNIHNIGITESIRDGVNNTGIALSHAEGLQLLNSQIHNIGRKAVGLIDTNGGLISDVSIYDVNLEAEHAQSHDAGGIKLFNTNDITIQDSYLSNINANYIWNDTTNGTRIENNVLEDVGEDFLAPGFNQNVDMSGISNEKSSNSTVINNQGDAYEEFLAFKATEFSTETMTLEGNIFSAYELGTTDYWVNESAEKLVALTEDPDSANYSLFADDYIAQANIGN
ncbi:right-handed parallel beta-helix repeat-containing protein [Waterburya agarophytonicola K14]|uniref:Right-handed parallel beta-helix repeat-containing protein n=1 Tax=Waterburya agarophytonicola KI4 TaxID=2874699 RepID=A0A964BPI5_9CYAN|nr:right-handed parallel beta-helix repeat-containing protein [Waterburya agarophytonicola]MCC0175967.1 right-handed parallel beta-helix repeat-containing protein [Waterburya agarophytonicola KI4]